MLTRVLEPEVMDSPEEAHDYDAMDHAEVNRVFVADFLAVWEQANPILDVGTGTAQIPIELCRQASRARITAVDLAGHMLQVARDNVRRAALEDRVILQQADAKDLPFPTGAFGAVLSNSIVHHIPEPQRVVAEMARMCRAGGLLFIRDLLRPETAEELHRLVAAYAGGATPRQQLMFADSLHAALNLAEIRALVAALGFDPAGVRQTTDRHWTWCTRTPAEAPRAGAERHVFSS
jgi:ubiquinone/menaquinone biosynthesis C-methylase UbiE